MARFLTAVCGALAVWVLYPLASWPVSGRLAARNLVHNRAHDVTDAPVHSQRAPDIAPLRYARCSCAQTGCGAVAVYNALWLRGLRPSLASVIHLMERRRCAAWGGRLGTWPRSLGGVLRACGVPFVRMRSLPALSAALCEGDVAILAIWNDRDNLLRGAHFFAVQKTASGCTACNREAPSAAGTLAEIVGRGRLITAYRLL